MITTSGYSKDPSIMPEGIAITFGQEMIELNNGLKNLLRWFQIVIADEDDYWMHRCKNGPKFDVQHVYIITAGRLYGRVPYAGFIRDNPKAMYGNDEYTGWTGIIMPGPFEKCPFDRELKGFRGFRYTTKLF